MSQLLRLGSFVVFLILGLWVRRLERRESRRWWVNGLLAYVIAVNGVAGLTQWDDWPFTAHVIAVGRPKIDSRVCMTEFRAVDARGVEWRVDPYGWSQVYDSILQYWFEQNFPRLSSDQQDRVLRFLLEKAEAARGARARGERIGYERLLGPAASPYWLLLPRPRSVGADPYTGLRVYSACWTPRERMEDPEAGTRTLRAEYTR